MCIITGCSNPSVAHGLCAKHYMRQRRAGVDAWPRNDDPYSAIVDSTFPEWSKRTRERFYYATRTLKYIEQTPGYEEIAQQITQRATRPNGSLNVSFLEREAHRIIVKWVRENLDELPLPR